MWLGIRFGECGGRNVVVGSRAAEWCLIREVVVFPGGLGSGCVNSQLDGLLWIKLFG